MCHLSQIFYRLYLRAGFLNLLKHMDLKAKSVKLCEAQKFFKDRVKAKKQVLTYV